MFQALGEQIAEFEKLREELITDVSPNRITFFFEGEVLTFDTYFYVGVKHFVDIIKLMVSGTEDIPWCLSCGGEEVLFICYPRCSTCQKARKWLDEHNINYTERHIVEDNPTYDELKEWHAKSGLPLKKFFNTSGLVYKEMQLKDKLPDMSEEELLQILATNGMLVKRPLVIKGDTIVVGFKESEWSENIFL